MTATCPSPPPPSHDGLPLPRLSDEAAVDIHFFLYQVLEFFEARYGDQIQRHYKGRSRDSLIDDSQADLNLDGPPF